MATAKKKTEAVAEVKTSKTEKKETAKAAEPKKETKAAPKAAEKKPAAPKIPAVKVFVEYQGRQVSQEDILTAVMAKVGKAKTVEVYVKPEDGAAYYVADGETGKVEF